jgi:hypothetical protein
MMGIFVCFDNLVLIRLTCRECYGGGLQRLIWFNINPHKHASVMQQHLTLRGGHKCGNWYLFSER